MIVVMDDSPAIWPNTPIIVVEKYSFWRFTHCAFHEQITVSVLSKEQRTRKIANVRIKSLPDDHLFDTVREKLLELHDIFEPAGECRTELVRERLIEYTEE